MINPELKENDPALAEVVEQLLDRYDRQFDLTVTEDQATLAEGLHELGHHIATNGQHATVEIAHGPKGLTALNITIAPK